MTNFATMNRTTLIALRICAARLDPKLAHEHFAQLVADLRESAENDALERGAIDDSTEPAAPTSSSTTAEEERPASGGERCLPQAAAPSTLPAAERPATSLSQESVGSATGGAGKRRLVTDADRDAIKADYLAALGTRKRVPRGTFERLVEKYGFAKTTLQSIVAKAQPGDAEHNEPATREHSNSNGCWCRKGANNAANPWCTNKPGPKHVPGLTDPRGNKLNVSRGAMGPPNYSD